MKYRCAKCDAFAMPDSMYCAGHRSAQEIEDTHGPRIEEAPTVMQRVLAKADRDDDLVVAEDFRDEAKRAAAEASEEGAAEEGRQLYHSAREKTQRELMEAMRVPLWSPTNTGVVINGVPWPIAEGDNSVPWQVKEAYDSIQKHHREDKVLDQLIKAQGDSVKPAAYIDDVLHGYRGEERPDHAKRSIIG